MQKGKFIVIYGANNLGKSLQVKLLYESLVAKNLTVKCLKYPIYDMEPTGPIINAVLRQGGKMSEKKLQEVYAKNRADYEPQLKQLLNEGQWVIAEDYVGTGIAWGLVSGVDLAFLENINKKLYPADISILVYGKRFLSGKETNHRNESSDVKWRIAQDKHMFLADKYKWYKVYANQKPEKVNKDIMEIIDSKLI